MPAPSSVSRLPSRGQANGILPHGRSAAACTTGVASLRRKAERASTLGLAPIFLGGGLSCRLLGRRPFRPLCTDGVFDVVHEATHARGIGAEIERAVARGGARV